MSREYDTFHEIEVDEKSTGPTRVLRTYGGLDSSTKNYFYHVLFAASILLLIVSLPLAFVYVPALRPVTDYKIDKGDKCWVTSMTRCENNLEAHIYFWNVTNPSQVLAGTHGPALREVGPYVLNNTINKRQNITFSNDDTEVSFISTLYADPDVESSCDGCALADEIVSFNLAYIGMVRTAGSETNILATALPRTIAALVDGITQLFGGLASDPRIGAAFPHIVVAAQTGEESLRALALEQIFTASPLGGISVTQLGNFGVPAALLAAFQHVPEYAIWAAAEASQPVTTVSIGAPVSNSIYSAMTSDTTGMTAAGMLMTDAATLATTFTIPAFQAQLWKGYLNHLMTTYGVDAFTRTLGPVLGPQSSGILIKRTVKDWIFGYYDPVVSPQYPADDPRRYIRSVTKIRNASTIDEDHVPWNVTDTSTWAYAYGSTPYRMATGIGLPENATNIVSRSDGAGPVVYPHTSHIERVRGKDIASGQYHEIKRSGESVDVSVWADFGMGLDLKRSLTLRHRQGQTVEKNAKVSVETYGIAHEEFVACPVNQTACGRNTKYHGTFNVSGFELIPSVYTLPHGYRADPRVFGGYVDHTSPTSPFSPNATKHDALFMIYQPSGNTFGMRVPIQQNFKIEPTDVFFTTLWPGSSPGDDVYVPISWMSLEYDMDDSFYESIKDTVTHIELLVATWTYICPAICAMGIVLSGVMLYIRRALRRRLVDNERYERDITRDDSRAIGSFKEKGLVQALKKKDTELFDVENAPAGAVYGQP